MDFVDDSINKNSNSAKVYCGWVYCASSESCNGASCLSKISISITIRNKNIFHKKKKELRL